MSRPLAVASDAVERDVRRAVELAWSWGVPDGQRPSVAALESWLYAHWFTRAQATPALSQFAQTSPSRWRAPARPLSGADGEGSRAAGGVLDSVVPRVRAAHAGLGLLERGWVTHSVDSSGDVVATRDGTLERVTQSTFVNLSRSGPTRVGDSLAVTRCADAVDADGVWWSTWTRQAPRVSDSLMRVYWNCGVDAIAHLINEVTRAFDESGWPYSLKCPTAAALFSRVDPVVLYLTPDVWTHARAELRAVHERLDGGLRCGVPPMTCQLADGVAVADDPANGLSFGQSRCRAVAAGIAHAVDEGVTDVPGATAVVLGALPAHGVSRDRPYERWPHGSPASRWQW